MVFALATSAGQPVQRFSTAAEVARAILDRPGPKDTFTLSRGACWPAGESHPAIAVYGHAQATAFLGYAIGFGHDREALSAALEDAKRNGGS